MPAQLPSVATVLLPYEYVSSNVSGTNGGPTSNGVEGFIVSVAAQSARGAVRRPQCWVTAGRCATSTAPRPKYCRLTLAQAGHFHYPWVSPSVSSVRQNGQLGEAARPAANRCFWNMGEPVTTAFIMPRW